MTKRRAPLTFERALSRVAGTIGWSTAADIVGKAENTVRNWSDPDTSAGVTLEAALKLDLAYRQAGGEGAPLLQCYALRLEADYDAACPDARALTVASARCAKEGGEAVEATALASLPGASDAELARAELELEEAIAAQTHALATVRAKRKSAPEVAPPAPNG